MKLSAASRCTRCYTRWRQSKLGLCRRCEKELGIAVEGTFEREQARLEQAQAKRRKAQHGYLEPHQRAEHARVARRPRAIALPPSVGQPWLDYVVVWSGDMDGADAMGLPMANDKRGSYRAREHWTGERKGSGLRHASAFDGDAQD